MDWEDWIEQPFEYIMINHMMYRCFIVQIQTCLETFPLEIERVYTFFLG
jgi:hypothetical protein